MPIALQLARRMTNALSLVVGSSVLIAVLTFSAEARADGPKEGASTAQVLAQESKPMPKAASHPATANANASAKPHAKTNANAKANAQPHPKAKTRPAKAKPQSKPAKAPAKPSKPTPSARV
jgi:hypothetical protein